MWVPREDLPALKHELRLILEGQGPEVCKRTLESQHIGERLREHAENCAECGAIVCELYPNGLIPVHEGPLMH